MFLHGVPHGGEVRNDLVDLIALVLGKARLGTDVGDLGQGVSDDESHGSDMGVGIVTGACDRARDGVVEGQEGFTSLKRDVEGRAAPSVVIFVPLAVLEFPVLGVGEGAGVLTQYGADGRVFGSHVEDDEVPRGVEGLGYSISLQRVLDVTSQGVG